MQLNFHNQAPSFSSKVKITHEAADFFSENLGRISKYGKQIKALERNGEDDIVEISQYFGCKEIFGGSDYSWPEMCVSVIKKKGSKLFRGTSHDSIFGATTGKLPKYTKNRLTKTPDLPELYKIAVSNLKEVKFYPSMKKYF